MEKIICENCGQEYSATFDACPLCGHINEQLGTNIPEPAAAYTAASDEAQRKRKERARDMNRIPTWLIAAICVVLGLAIIIGAIYIISSMGLFRSDAQTAQTAQAPASQVETLPEVSAPEEPVPEQPAETAPAEAPVQAQSPDPEEPVLNPEEDLPPEVEETETPGDEEQEPSQEEDPEAAKPEDETTPAEEGTEHSEVPDVSCDSITLDRSDITLAFRGETFTFSPVVTPSSAKNAIQWSSSNEELVTVTQDGTVNARVGTGDDYVVITAQCGDKKATCIVRCSFETATELLPLSLEDVTLFYAGETVTLSVLDEQITETVTWSSSNPGVVSVDESGKLTAMGGGTAEIQASCQGRTGSCIVRCSFGSAVTTTDSATGDGSSAAAYALTYTDVTMFHEGESFTLGVTASAGEVPEHTWSTSNSDVCTVDASGKVTAVGAGTANILTTVNGQLLQCVVRINIAD